MEEELEGTDRDNPTTLTRSQRIMIRISVVQTILAVAAMFTGAIALWAALNEADAVRKQQQAAAWPFVESTFFNSSLPGSETFQLKLINKGLGPAKIKYAVAELGGEVKRDWWDLIGEAANVDIASGEGLLLSNAPANSRVLAPNETLEMITVDRFAKATTSTGETKYDHVELLQRLRAGVGASSFRLQVCYCSVFEDCWMLDRGTKVTTEEVDSCPVQPEGVVY